MKKKLLPVVMFLATTCYSQGFDKAFMKADTKHNLNYELLRAVATHESGMNPLSIGFVIKTDALAAAVDGDLKSASVKYKKRPYKKWYHYSLFFASAQDATKAIPWLEKATAASTGYDIGVMQVNSRNATRNGWSVERLLSEPEYNIDCAAGILAGCRDSFKWDPTKTLECYNKGTRVAIFDYQYYGAVFSKFKKGGGIEAVVQNQNKPLPKRRQVVNDQVMPQEFKGERTLF